MLIDRKSYVYAWAEPILAPVLMDHFVMQLWMSIRACCAALKNIRFEGVEKIIAAVLHGSVQHVAVVSRAVDSTP
jgi:hypothetical protein